VGRMPKSGGAMSRSAMEVSALLTDIRQHWPPLRGVFHLAGVLDDGILREQTRDRFDRVLAAKAHGPGTCMT